MANERDSLDHVPRDAADLLLRAEVRYDVKVKCLVAFDDAGPDTFELLPVLAINGVVVFRPNEVKHGFDAELWMEGRQVNVWLTKEDEYRTYVGRLKLVLVRNLEEVHSLEDFGAAGRDEELVELRNGCLDLLDEPEGLGVVLLGEAELDDEIRVDTLARRGGRLGNHFLLGLLGRGLLGIVHLRVLILTLLVLVLILILKVASINALKSLGCIAHLDFLDCSKLIGCCLVPLLPEREIKVSTIEHAERVGRDETGDECDGVATDRG